MKARSPLKRTRIKASKKTRARRAALLIADCAARDAVFERDEFKCVRCGKETNLQWCHIFSRRYRDTRQLPENALTMCAGCHMWWHHEPILATDWFRKTWPERYELLLSIRNAQ